MKVKFNRRLEDYDYIISFDLAKHKTGYSLVDFKNKTIPVSGIIITEETEMPWEDFYSQLEARVGEIVKDFGSSFFVLKERLPNQAGPRSTIAALQGLAMAHAIFNLFVAQHSLDYYDWEGVHSISVKSYYKNLTGLQKPQKIDIFRATKELYPRWEVPEDNELSYDISDSIAVAQTLLGKKWNADINEEIRALNKEIKAAKSPKKIQRLQEEVDRLKNLKIEEG